MRSIVLPAVLIALAVALPSAARAQPATPLREARTDALCTTTPTTINGQACGDECKARVTSACAAIGKVGASGSTATALAVGSASWQSAVIGGLADFVAGRAKGEVIAWVEGLVADKLCALKYKVISDAGADAGQPTGDDLLWFPGTCQILQDPNYGMQKSTGMIAAAIRDDLAGLPRAVGYHELQRAYESAPDAADKNNSCDKSCVAKRNQHILRDIAAATVVVDRFRRGDAPLEILAGLGREQHLRDQCAADQTPNAQLTIECVAVTTGLFVEYFGSAVTVQNVGAKRVKQPDDLITAVLGSQQLACEVQEMFAGKDGSDCTGSNPPAVDLKNVPEPIKTILQLLTSTADVYRKYQPKVVRLLDAMVRLQSRVQAVTDKPPTVEQAHDLVTSFAEVADAGFALIGETDSDADKGLRSLIHSAHDVVAIAGDLGTQDYMAAGAAFVDATNTLGIDLPGALKQFLAFVIDVASARTSDDVSQAIERVAAPIGGWRLKRDHLTLSVTAYVGADGGYEWPDKRPLAEADKAHVQGGWAGALFAPVGVDLTGPLGPAKLGLTLSILDVGQLTWARLSDVSTDTDTKAQVAPTTNFIEVLSPGVYGHIALGNSPFVFGTGFSYAPALRKYTIGTGATATQTDPLSTLRWSLFLAVDVTIFPIWVHGS